MEQAAVGLPCCPLALFAAEQIVPRACLSAAGDARADTAVAVCDRVHREDGAAGNWLRQGEAPGQRQPLGPQCQPLQLRLHRCYCLGAAAFATTVALAAAAVFCVATAPSAASLMSGDACGAPLLSAAGRPVCGDASCLCREWWCCSACACSILSLVLPIAMLAVTGIAGTSAAAVIAACVRFAAAHGHPAVDIALRSGAAVMAEAVPVVSVVGAAIVIRAAVMAMGAATFGGQQEAVGELPLDGSQISEAASAHQRLRPVARVLPRQQRRLPENDRSRPVNLWGRRWPGRHGAAGWLE